jgi:hypothetical protein
MRSYDSIEKLMKVETEYIQCDYCGRKEYDLSSERGAIQGPLLYGWCKLQVKIADRLYKFSDMCEKCVEKNGIIKE